MLFVYSKIYRAAMVILFLNTQFIIPRLVMIQILAWKLRYIRSSYTFLKCQLSKNVCVY